MLKSVQPISRNQAGLADSHCPDWLETVSQPGILGMTVSSLSPVSLHLNLKRRTFARRALMPLGRDYIWQISAGVVRTLTVSEDGTPITLGLWGPGDIVGRALSKAEPYQIECLTPVDATILPAEYWPQTTEAMIRHIQQFQEFLQILHCRSVDASLIQLLTWLAKRFGREIEQGQLIDLRLTHQEIAEIIGATRVTVTRLLNDFEKRGIIQRLSHRFILTNDQQPFWHYEI